MPWAAAATVVGAGLSSAAAGSASRGQQDAAQQANDLQQAQYNGATERNQPFLQGGYDALARLQTKLPDLNASYNPQDLLNEPGYQFGLQQGQQALERSMAAKGRGVSGAALKAASEYGTNYGTTKLNDAFNRDQSAKNQQFSQLFQLSNLGQTAANNTNLAGQSYANNAGTNLMGAADSAATNDLAQGNIWSGLVNQGASMYGGGSGNMGNNAQAKFSNTSLGSSGYGTGLAYGNNDMGQFLADGGPVRSEPRVGSKGSVRDSGGGPLSRDAIFASLMQAHMERQQPSGIGALPTNPVTNPGGIRTAQMQQIDNYAHGGKVAGPGGPRDDAIPAHLSNGEHVIDAESVTAMGDGDNERGQALLNELRQRVKAHSFGKTRKH